VYKANTKEQFDTLKANEIEETARFSYTEPAVDHSPFNNENVGY